MSNTEIQEAGNSVIAEFMNLKAHEWDFDGTPMKIWIDKGTELTFHDEPELWYHSSWDWLMPVVKKINTIAIDEHGEMGVWITPVRCLIGEDEYNPLVMTTKGNHPELIDMVWTAVITFIQWFNQNKKP